MATSTVIEVAAAESNILVSEETTSSLITTNKDYSTVILAEQDPQILVNNDTQIEIIEICSPCTEATTTPSTGTAVIGALFIQDVTPNSGGIVSSKVWTAGTVPVEADIIEATTDKDEVLIHVYVEGDSTIYTPIVTVNGFPLADLVQDTYDKRTYIGLYPLVVTEDTTVNVATSTGLTDSVLIKRAAAGPNVTDIAFGAYPGTQTELKAGDVINVTVTTDIEATSVTIYSFGSVDGTTLAVTNGTATGVLTVSTGTGQLAAKAYATNSFGTDGVDFTSVNTLLLDQTYPTIGAFSVGYPAGQLAIKDTEIASVTSEVVNFDTISYSTSADILINESVNTYENTKTVTRQSGDYIVSGSNYTIDATRTANAATSTRSGLVYIVNVPVSGSITIDGTPSRLRSTSAGKNYTVRITTDQQIQGAPTLDADLGTLGASFSGAYPSFSNTITIFDTTARGTGTFSNFSATGLSNIIGTVITSGSNYTVGGIELRILTFGVISTHEFIGTNIADINKVRVKLTGTTQLFTLQNSTADVIDGFTITDSAGVYNITGDYLYLTSAALTGSNSSGTLQVDIEELV